MHIWVDDSEIGRLKPEKQESTVSEDSKDSTTICETSLENDDQAITLVETLEEEEHQEDDEKEEIDVILASESAGKIRFTGLGDSEDGNHTNADEYAVEDKVENE